MGRRWGGVVRHYDLDAALAGAMGEDGASRACLEFVFQGIAARGGPSRSITGVGVLEDDTLAAFGSNRVQQGMFLAF